MNLSIIVLSDPGAGDEALGRLFNALALAHEAHTKGDDVVLIFQGAGTRWPAELARLDHPARGLYDSVRTLVVGASRACAAVFGATDAVAAGGLEPLADNPIPGTPGLNSIRRSLAEGRATLIF